MTLAITLLIVGIAVIIGSLGAYRITGPDRHEFFTHLAVQGTFGGLVQLGLGITILSLH